MRTGTAAKTFLVFFIALLPLGVIAVLGILQAIRTSDQERVALTQLSVEQSANRLTRTLSADRRAIKLMLDTIPQIASLKSYCERASASLIKVDFIVYDRQGNSLCSSGQDTSVVQNQRFVFAQATLDSAGDRLLTRTMSGDLSMVGIASYSPRALADVLRVNRNATIEPSQFTLRLGDRSLSITQSPQSQSGRPIAVHAPSDLDLMLFETGFIEPMSAGRVVTLFLPLALWLLAAGVAWYLVHRLLVAPLIQLQRAVALYRPGDEPNAFHARSHVIEELNILGESFRGMAHDVSNHEQQMLESLDRQRRLTREVHHRVKNNLQIITSLVSLHSRGAKGDEALAAYATIQRRVDALAVVHRNHFAEIEHNEGINASSLLSELASSVRGSGRDLGRHFTLKLQCDPLMVEQDVAIPISFLITELVDLSIRVDRNADIQLSFLRETDDEGVEFGCLSVRSPALADSPALEACLQEGFGRVLTGLSRQLRRTLEWDGDEGHYSIYVPIIA